MDYESFVAQIELDREWREAEIRLLLNDLNRREREDERNLFRRPLVAIQYAHYEGFTKFVLQHYATAVSGKLLECDKVINELVALSFNDVFRELRNPNPKGKLFKGALPTDNALHKFAREHHFIAEIRDVFSKRVNLPDDVIDTDSNLTPDILRKNLYRLGLSVDSVDSIEGQLNQLINARNGIAHGDARMKNGITEETYLKFAQACKTAMDNVDQQVRDCYRNHKYLKMVA